jgi:hypothetical protein
MTVPSSNSHLKNTTGGAFSSQTQGGTIINNDDTGVVITKAFQLNDAVAATTDASTLPSVSGGGGGNTFKPLSGGTFGYAAEGKYVIARSSDTLSGVSNTKLLFMGAGDQIPIPQFMGDMGAKLLTAFRNNQFSWTHTLDSGAKITNMRINWLNSAGTAAAPPAALNGNYPWAPGGATRNGTGAFVRNTDAAANGYAGAADVSSDTLLGQTGLRNVPGRLVMAGNFKSLNPWTTVKVDDRPNFYVYKPITGM